MSVSYYSGCLNTLRHYLMSLLDAIIGRIKSLGNPLAELEALKNLMQKMYFNTSQLAFILNLNSKTLVGQKYFKHYRFTFTF
ncbi:MAG: hypothetical protein AB4372_00430 [Xenococcus sp. (in: cyanobacteria)]